MSLTPETKAKIIEQGYYVVPDYSQISKKELEKQLSGYKEYYQTVGLTSSEAQIMAERSIEAQQSLLRPTGLQRTFLALQVPQREIEKFIYSDPTKIKVRQPSLLEPLPIELQESLVLKRAETFLKTHLYPEKAMRPITTLSKIRETIKTQSIKDIEKDRYKNLLVGRDIVEFRGATVVDIGTWFMPYGVGGARATAFLASYVGEAGLAPEGVIGYAKERPVKTAFAGLLGFGAVAQAFGRLPTLRVPKRIEPTPKIEKAVEPFTRQRATVILKTEKGEYVLGKTPSGEIISIGGGIEKGQTARQAALAELKQETGLTLTLKDIEKFKYKEKIVFPEETFYVYTAIVKDVSKIRPASDIRSIVKIKPSQVRGVTGQTALFPVSRPIIFPFGRIRSYEAGIINYLETGVRPTWLAIETRRGTYFLGTQSRYDVPFEAQRLYLGKEIYLAHGTPKPAVLQSKLVPIKRQFTIQAAKTKRGAAQGLYLQPPIYASEEAAGYIGLSYLGIGKGTSEGLTLKIGWKRPTAYIFREKAKGEIIPTPKTLAGIESELLIRPETQVATIARPEVFYIAGRRVYAQPMQILRGADARGEAFLKGKEIKTFEELGKQYYYVQPERLGAIAYRPSKEETKIIKSDIKLFKKEERIKPLEKTRYFEKDRGVSIPISKPPYIPPYKTPPSRPPYKIPPSRPPYIPPYKTPPYIPPPRTPPYTPPPEEKFKSSISEDGKFLTVGFDVYIKRKGKWIKISKKALTRAKALQLGARRTRETLAARFKIVKSKKPVEVTREVFKPSPEIFRAYKIVKGKKVPLRDEYIQKASKRLGTMGEVREIQTFRKSKQGRLKWL